MSAEEANTAVPTALPASRPPLTGLAAGMLIGALGRVAGRGLHVASQVVLGRVLGPATFGIYALGWTVFRVVGTLGSAGLENGVVKYGAPLWPDAGRSVGRLTRAAMLSSAVIALVFAGAGWGSARILSDTVFGKPELMPVLAWFALALPIYSALRVAAALTRIGSRVGTSVVAEELAPPLVQLTLLLAISSGMSVTLAVGTAAAGFGAGLLVAMVALAWMLARMPRADAKDSIRLRSLFGFSVPTALAGTVGMLNTWLDRLMLGVMRPASDVGIYQAASQFSMVFAMLLAAIGAVFAPMAAGYAARNDVRALERLFTASTRWGLYASLPLAATLLAAPETAVTVVFGGGFRTGGMALAVLVAAQLANVATGPVGYLLIMTGDQRWWMQAGVGALLGNGLLNLLLIPRYGFVGAALATGASLAALFVAGVVRAWLRLGLLPYDRRAWRLAFATVATMTAAAMFAKMAAGLQPLTAFLVVGGSSAAAFFASMAVLGLEPEDRALANEVRRRMSSGVDPGAKL